MKEHDLQANNKKKRNPLIFYKYIQSYPQIIFPSLILVKYHTTYNQQEDQNRLQGGG